MSQSYLRFCPEGPHKVWGDLSIKRYKFSARYSRRVMEASEKTTLRRYISFFQRTFQVRDIQWCGNLKKKKKKIYRWTHRGKSAETFTKSEECQHIRNQVNLCLFPYVLLFLSLTSQLYWDQKSQLVSVREEKAESEVKKPTSPYFPLEAQSRK